MKNTVQDIDLYTVSVFVATVPGKSAKLMVSFTVPLNNTQIQEFKTYVTIAFGPLCIIITITSN